MKISSLLKVTGLFIMFYITSGGVIAGQKESVSKDRIVLDRMRYPTARECRANPCSTVHYLLREKNAKTKKVYYVKVAIFDGKQTKVFWDKEGNHTMDYRGGKYSDEFVICEGDYVMQNPKERKCSSNKIIKDDESLTKINREFAEAIEYIDIKTRGACGMSSCRVRSRQKYKF